MVLAMGLLWVWAGCGSGDPPLSDTSAVGTTTTLPSINVRDSLYRLYFAALTDTLPRRQNRESGKLYPVDEAPLDTAFFIFREELRQAVREKSVMDLLDRVAPEIKVSFGSETGKPGLIKIWGLGSEQQNQESALWTHLGEVLDAGGVFNDNRTRFTAPYYFDRWPDAYDAFEYAAITGTGVRLRAAATLESKILTNLSYDVVRVLTYGAAESAIGGDVHPWHQVALLDGTEGYVYGKYLKQAIGYRAGFERRSDGAWHMTFFLAGD